jgi:glycosyltransferase involved in cell wall biosynthesis
MINLAIVIPCFNEQEMLPNTINTLVDVLKDLAHRSKISAESILYLVDDGSRDKTWDIISERNSNNAHVKGLKLTRNFGNQNALLAGLLNVRKYNPDCVISMDADLQQDEHSIGLFIDKYLAGADIVFGVRNSREGDSPLKKYPSLFFYKLMNIFGVSITPNHSDYRLVSRKALDILTEYNEVNLFLRGIFQEIGLKTAYVNFDVKPRFIGKSRYTLKSLTSLAVKGITSFSIVPLRLVALLGLLMALLSFGFAFEVMYEKYILKSTIPGWSTIVIAICFMGGMQILCTGIIGEYLGQVYKEVKARPRFVRDIELS